LLESCSWVLELLLVKYNVPCDFFAGAGISALVRAMWAGEAGGILRRRARLYVLHLALVLAYLVSWCAGGGGAGAGGDGA
jgi:hypothetical protein